MTTNTHDTTPTFDDGDIRDVADALRRAFNLPDAWIDTCDDIAGDGYVARVALNMCIEDVGDAENGPRMSAYPTRWMHVGRGYAGPDDRRFVVRVYDVSNVDDEADYGAYMQACDMPVRTHILGNIDARNVAPHVVAMTATYPDCNIDRGV